MAILLWEHKAYLRHACCIFPSRVYPENVPDGTGKYGFRVEHGLRGLHGEKYIIDLRYYLRVPSPLERGCGEVSAKRTYGTRVAFFLAGATRKTFLTERGNMDLE